ncbi:MAG: ankyrin repeat domain-containing protein [Mycoplasmoidaceae bacterium]
MNRNKINDKDFNLLFDACHIGNVKLIKAVCDYDNINYQNNEGYTLIAVACMRNDILMIKSLLKFIPNPNIKTNDGFSPLMFSIKNNNLEAVKLLVESGASVNDKKGMANSLMFACSYGFIEIVEYLVEQGSKINITDNEGNNLLMIASKEDQLKIVKFLLSKQIDINQVNKKGNNALMYAILSNHIDVVKILIENGIDINAYNKEGTTPLMLAVQYKRYNIINELLSNSEIEINKIDFDGYTALMYGCLIEDIKSIAFLINDKRTSINKTNHDNETALIIAVKKDNEDITTLLLSKMANVKIKNIKGENAFKIAATNGNFKIAKIILDYSSLDDISYDFDLIESYKKQILKFEKDMIDSNNSNIKINLNLNDSIISEQIKLNTEQIENIKNEIDVDIKDALNCQSIEDFKFIPNNFTLKQDCKEIKNLNSNSKEEPNKILNFINESEVIKENNKTHTQKTTNDLYLYETTVNKKIELNNHNNPISNLDFEHQYQIMNNIDHSIHDLITNINNIEQKQSELDQSWLDLNVDVQKEILDLDIPIIEKMKKWIEFVEKTKFEKAPESKFLNCNELIIIENNNLIIDKEKYQKKIYEYWEKINNK